MADSKGKAVVFLIIVILIILALGGGAFYLYQQEHDKNLSLTSQLEDAQAKYKKTQVELEDAKSRIAVLETGLKDAQDRAASLSDNLRGERKSKEDALAKIAELQGMLKKEAGVKSDLEKQLSDSAQTLKEMEARVKEMDDQLKDLESKKQALEGKVRDLEAKAQNVELGKIVVSPEGQGGSGLPASARLSGTITVVNKEYNFAVISVGSKDGVAVGNLFSVMHAGKLVGELKVEKVHESMSAAGFGSADLKDKISEGDTVELKG